MTHIFNWPVRISIFFRKLFVIYFIKKLLLKSEDRSKNDLVKAGV